MSWSRGLGYLEILQRPGLERDPETRSILRLTRLAGGLQDLWLSISRRNPTLLERTLASRPGDGRTVGRLIMACMDDMGRTCDAYLDREMDAADFRSRVGDHVKGVKALVTEIKVEDIGLGN